MFSWRRKKPRHLQQELSPEIGYYIRQQRERIEHEKKEREKKERTDQEIFVDPIRCIDRALGDLSRRSLVEAEEATDTLLDLRGLLEATRLLLDLEGQLVENTSALTDA